MTTPEMAAEVALDVLIDLAENGADVRSPEGSGPAFTVEQHGTALQRAKLDRLRLTAAQKHGAEPMRGKATTRADAGAIDRVDRVLNRAFGLEQA